MAISLTNGVFLYLALFFIFLAFFLWFRSSKRRKKFLEKRRALSDKFLKKKTNQKTT